jgi:hypothetical protein
LFQPLLAENQKKKTHGKIWAKKEDTLALQRWGPQLFSDSAPHLSFSTSGEIQREVSTNIIYIYQYIYICMYVYVYTSVSAGWCEQPPWNPKFSEREQLLGGTQKNFHANCLDHGWIKLFLAFFCYRKTWKTPAIFQLQMYYRVIYQVLSTTKQSAHSTPKYSISLWSSPCFLSAKTAKSSWVVHTFLVNVGVIETVNCWPFHWKIYG